MNLKRSILMFLAAGCLAAVVPTNVYSAPRLQPNPFLAATGRMSEPLPVDTMLLAALRVSGTPEDEIPGLVRRVDELLDAAEDELDKNSPDRDKGEFVLRFLHDNVFTVYDEFQTRIDVTLRRGTFNCVSSAVLFMVFARSFDLPVSGVATADHAFCSVILPDERVDVETTTIHGYDPGKKKEFQDSFGNVTGYSYVPPSDYSGRNDLGERELIALVIQNRISMLENTKRYSEAASLAVDRYALAPNEVTHTHLARELVNYAALLNDQKEYSTAVEFLSEAIDLYGWHEEYRNIYQILHYNTTVAFLQAGNPREALRSVEIAADAGWMSEDTARELRTQAGERIIAQELPQLSYRESLNLVADLRNEGLLSDNRYKEYSIMFYSRIADEHAQQKQYLLAAGVIDSAISEIGKDGRLSEARTAYRFNFTVEIHNTFASLFNQKNYREAQAVVEEALEQVPESKMLAEDLDTVKKVLSR